MEKTLQDQKEATAVHTLELKQSKEEKLKSNSLGSWSKTNLPFEWDSVSLGFNPPPLAKWETLKFGLFGSNFVPCERLIKIKVVSEEKMTKVSS